LLTLAKRLITHLPPLVLHIDFALEWGQADAGKVLCRQGENSDSIFIVLNGRLRSIVERGQRNGFEIVGEYGQGESVGELEVLTDTPRPHTVHAIRDTEVAIMPKSLFNTLALKHPEITIQISRMIAFRSRKPRPPPIYSPGPAPGGEGSGERGYGNNGGSGSNEDTVTASSSSGFETGRNNANLKTVAVLPVTSGVPITEFSDRLKEGLSIVGGSVILLNSSIVMGKLGRHVFSRIGRLKLMSWLAEIEESVRIVVYVADSGVNNPWTQRCVKQADCILLVALADEDPSIGEFERLLLGMKTYARKELVLLHPERNCASGTTAAWLKNRLWIHAHHHVRKLFFLKRFLY